MKTAAAKGSSSSWRLIAAGAALLAAVPAAEASRTSPTAANALIEKQASSSIPSARPAADLDPTCAFALTSCFSLALTPASAPSRSEKLASGPPRFEPQRNLFRICTLGPILRWIVWKQGNTIRYSYDAFGQLTGIEDDLGRRYKLEYYDDPKPESEGGDGPRYGLLKKVEDFAKRVVEYEYDTDRRLTKVKLPEVTTTAPEYGQYAFTGSSRPTVEYRYEPSANVTDDEADTHAVLHGDFAKLRLEGFEQPGSDVLRARFEYDATTGRAKTIAFPDAGDHNDSGSGVQWAIAYPSEPSDAAPATSATVAAPWLHEVVYTIAEGRTTKVEETGVEALAATDTTPAVGAAIPTKTLTTSFEHEDDGRLKKLTAADGSQTEYAYAGTDLLTKANVRTLTEKAGAAAKGPVAYTETATSFTYSADNLVERTTDAQGRAISTALATGGGGPATSGYHAESVLTTSTFDVFGRVTGSQTAGAAPIISSLSFGQDKRGKPNAGLLDSITASGFTETFRYNERDQVKERSTSYGTSSTFTNDEWDRTVDEETGKSTGALAPVDAKAQRAFDAAGRLVRERRYQEGIGWVETRWEYSARDQVKSVTQTGLAGAAPGGGLVEGTTTYGYDTYGRLSSTTSPAGIVSTTSYDSAGRVASTRTGASAARTRGYDELGRLVFSSDGDQGFWRGRFDGWGRMYEEASAASALIEREHDTAGGLTRATAFADASKTTKLQETLFDVASFGATKHAEERVFGGGSPSVSVLTRNTFDGAGRVTQTSYGPADAERVERTVTFEPGTGRTLSLADAVGNTTTFAYVSGAPWADRITTAESGSTGIQIASAASLDAFGRALREERAGTVVERHLDEAGNLLSASIGGSNRQELTYDARGLVLTSHAPAIGRHVSSAYDRDGRLLIESVARHTGGQEQTAYAYDASGRMSARTRPASPTEVLTYNLDDTVATVTTRQGLTLTYGYDAANRVTSIVPSGSPAGPSRLAPLDGGDVMTYDPLGRLTSVGIGGRPESFVTYTELDSRGLPRVERVAAWPQGAAIERQYDAFGNTTATTFPQGVAGTLSFPGFAASYDALDRLTSTTPIQGSAAFGATLTWGGQARPLATTTSTGLASSSAYDTAGGRIAALTFTAGQTALGSLTYGWDAARDLKIGREAPATSTTSVLSSLGWTTSYDAAHRMDHAETGQGSVAGAATTGAALGAWTYELGTADELLAVVDHAGGRAEYVSGPQGRIESRSGPDGAVPFAYDLEGRRIEDDRSSYTWDWRGRLVQVDPKAGEHAGERLAYAYDGAGRLLSTTNLGEVPEGGGDADRPFVAKRAYVWDGQRLAATAGLNFEDEPIWRSQYAPGPRWLDDAPQVRIERDLLGTPSTATFDLLRDELGTVLAVTEARQDGTPRLLARFLTSPYGEQHVELGPELVRITFDGDLTALGAEAQEPVTGESVGGALRVVTTLPLAPASLAAGIVIEQWAAGAGWTPADRDDYAVGTDPTDAASVLILRLPAWPKEARYRITLTSVLADGLGRPLRLPEGETGGVAVSLEVPGDGQTLPAYDRHFEITPDESPAGDTLGGELPGGLGIGFQGLLADGATDLLHARNRVLDPHTASWLSPDPLGDLDSPNLYAYVAWQPHMATDPLGTEVSVSNSGVFVVSDVRSGRRGKISRFSRAWGQENKVGLLTILVGAGGLSQPEALRLMGEHGVQIQSNTPEALAALAIQMGAVDEFVTAATKAYVTSWAAAATGGAAGFALEAAGASSFAASSGGAFLAGVAAQGTSDLMQGELSGLDSYLTAGAVSTAGLWAFQGGASLLRSGGGQTFGLGLEPPTVTWRNGWRTPDGKFASPTGGPRPGAPAEEAVWEAVAQKPGWQVVEGRVYVTDSTGQVRVYDGAAISPSGRTIGLEVKSGTATRDLAQRTFDLRLNSNPDNAAIGIGRNRGLVVRRALQIRR